MADAIREETGTQVELIQGGGGIFDVVVDGEMIFSKHQVDRFPEHEEILEKLRDR